MQTSSKNRWTFFSAAYRSQIQALVFSHCGCRRHCLSLEARVPSQFGKLFRLSKTQRVPIFTRNAASTIPHYVSIRQKAMDCTFAVTACAHVHRILHPNAPFNVDLHPSASDQILPPPRLAPLRSEYSLASVISLKTDSCLIDAWVSCSSFCPT